MNRDREHLRLLSIFHYVLAGLTACVSLIFVVYVVVGALLGTGVIGDRDHEAGVAGLFLLVIGLACLGLTLGFAGVVAYAGRCLARCERHTFCFVVAALLCLSVPFGTVLGVFTILVLARDSVRELFGKPALAG